jgi:hypothetical protein
VTNLGRVTMQPPGNCKTETSDVNKPQVSTTSAHITLNDRVLDKSSWLVVTYR